MAGTGEPAKSGTLRVTNVVAASCFRNAGDDGVFKILQLQLAGALKIRLVRGINDEVGQQSVNRLVCEMGACPFSRI